MSYNANFKVKAPWMERRLKPAKSRGKRQRQHILCKHRQAQDVPPRRLLIDLFDGLACNLDGLGAVVRYRKKVPFILFYWLFL